MTAWFGNSAGHAAAGRKGGRKQNWKIDPANWRNNPKAAEKAGRQGGSAPHKSRGRQKVTA